MNRSKNQDKSADETEEKLSKIQDQLQKVMDGMMSMSERNSQAGKELLGLKEAFGLITQRGKEQIVDESLINRGEPL